MQAAITEPNTLVNLPQNAEKICGIYVIYAAEICKDDWYKGQK